MFPIDYSVSLVEAGRAVLEVQLFDGYRSTLLGHSCGPLVYDVYLSVLSPYLCLPYMSVWGLRALYGSYFTASCTV